MKKEMQDNLLDKYYKGETSLEEENNLKTQIITNKNSSSEKDIFNYLKNESYVPDDLEDQIFATVNNNEKRKKSIKINIFRWTSAAAVILILLSLYIDFRSSENRRLENEFFVMEQALFQVSESIQPQEQEEMLVLWVDDNVEIIIN